MLKNFNQNFILIFLTRGYVCSPSSSGTARECLIAADAAAAAGPLQQPFTCCFTAAQCSTWPQLAGTAWPAAAAAVEIT
jgi:hypothetical protein